MNKIYYLPKFQPGGKTEEYFGGTLEPAKMSVSLTSDQWNDLYRRGKISLSQIPRKYQSYIQGDPRNSGMLNIINQGRQKFLTDAWNLGEVVVDSLPIIGDIKGLTLDPYLTYKNGGVGAALKMAGLGLIGFLPGVGDAASKVGKKYAVRHGVPKKVVKQNIEKGTLSAVAPSIALTNPERLAGFSYAGRDGVTFLGDNTLLKNAELYLGDAQTPTIQRVMNHYKLPKDIPQEELLEYVKRYADEVYRAGQPIAAEEVIRKGISGVSPYNEAKVYEVVPYNKFKAAITDHRNTDIIKMLSDEGLEVLPIYPEYYPMNRELSEIVNWEANNFYYDHPEYLFSKGGRLYPDGGGLKPGRSEWWSTDIYRACGIQKRKGHI